MSSSRLLSTTRLQRLAGVTGAQASVQLLAFASGLVIVRTLDPSHYALYTLAIALVGMSAVLSELGLTSAVLARGGQCGAAPASTAAVLVQAERLHGHLALWALPLAAAGGVALLLRHGASPALAVTLTVAASMTAWWQVRGALRLAALRLHGRVLFTQGLDVAVQGTRAVLLLALAGLAWLGPTSALVVGLGAAMASAALLAAGLRRAPSGAEGGGSATTTDPVSHRTSLASHVRRQAPNSVYYLFSGQLAVWLVGIFGSATSVAEVGALGRLAALFALVGAVAAALVQPWFARTRDSGALRAGFVAVNAGLALLLVALLSLAIAAPQSLLWVLGGHYGGLQAELPWLVLGGTLTAWGGVVYGLGAARGWVLPFALSAPLGLVTTAVLAALVDAGSARGALVVTAGVAGAGWMLAFTYVARELWRSGPVPALPGPVR